MGRSSWKPNSCTAHVNKSRLRFQGDRNGKKRSKRQGPVTKGSIDTCGLAGTLLYSRVHPRRFRFWGWLYVPLRSVGINGLDTRNGSLTTERGNPRLWRPSITAKGILVAQQFVLLVDRLTKSEPVLAPSQSHTTGRRPLQHDEITTLSFEKVPL